MNRFSDVLLQAFEIAMDEKLSTLEYDKTIQATITEVADADNGEYRIKYQDGIISAFAQDPKEEFKVGDAVYVTVPQGDFSNKKFISHKITNNSLSYGQSKDLSETVIEISPNFSALGITYGGQGSDGVWSLIAGEKQGESDEIIIASYTYLPEAIKPYRDKYEYLQIKAEFMTTFDQNHTQGKYGVNLSFVDKSGNLIPYFLTFDNFVGDPYRLWTWMPQTVIVKLPKGTIDYLKQISFYEDGFIRDGDKPNIFMRNLSISFVELVDLTQTPYYLSITTDKGISFGTSISTIALEGKIIHYGSEVRPSNCIYKWFERDLSVQVGSEDYDKRVGWGWKAIEGQETSTMKVTKSTWNLKTFKLLVVYDSNIVLTQEITLIDSILEASIQQNVIGQNIELQLISSDSAKSFVGDWYYLDSDGTQKVITYTSGQTEKEAKKIDKVVVNKYLYHSPVTFYCCVYKFEQGEQNYTYLGDLTYIMRNMESSDDVSVVFVGEAMFSYDANGDINIYDAELERTLTPEIIFNSGVISSSVTIDWLDPNGNPIGTDEDASYAGGDSMIKTAWVETKVDTNTKILHYKVKHKYQMVSSNKNNAFKIRITTIDNQQYFFDKEILFTKTGDPGTNGTRYQSFIYITDNTKRFVSTGNDQSRTVNLKCLVYKDQTEWPGDPTIKWELFNLGTQQDPTNTPTLTVYANNSNRRRYVKVTVTISEEGKTTILYDFFPIDSCNSSSETFAKNIDLSGLPKYVQYSTSGRNPQFKRQVPKIIYNGIEAQIIGEKDATGLAVIDVEGSYFKLVDQYVPPITAGDNKNLVKNIGLLKITIGGTVVFHPVPTYINTFGNEDINSWDGMTAGVDDKGNSIFAPQIGAGQKNNSNQFTGVIMGQVAGQSHLGLYGYQEGETSFGLLDDGTAYFGKASGGGRIEINGSSATIKGGGGGDTDNGMTLQLKKTDDKDNTLAIQVGNDKFKVNYGGKITATEADIQGEINASKGFIGRTSRTSSDGWSIKTNQLYSGSGSNHVELNSDINNNYTIWAGADTPNSSSERFSVKRDGTVFMREATVKGTITATAGSIANWIISGSKLKAKVSQNDTAGSDSFYLDGAHNASYMIYASKGTNTFSVSRDGIVNAVGAVISGSITANSGAIGGWDIVEKKLYSNKVTLYSGTSYGYNIDDNGYNVATLAANANYYNNKIQKQGAYETAKSVAYSVSTASKVVNDIEYIPIQFFTDNTTLSNSIYYVEATELTNTDPYRIWAGSSYLSPNSAKFFVTNSGVIKATEADITGTINAKKGYIGWQDDANRGWEIDASTIKSHQKTFGYIKAGVSYYSDSNNIGDKYLLGKFENDTATDDKLDNSSLYTDSQNRKRIKFYLDGKLVYGYLQGATNLENYVAGNETGYGITLSTRSGYALWGGTTESPKDAVFSVTQSGKLKASSATISGKITADSGKIAGWTISGNKLQARRTAAEDPSTSNLYLDGGPWGESSAKYVIYMKATDITPSEEGEGAASTKGAFYVTADGYMFAENARIKGNIQSKSGSIGGWSITDGKLYSDNGRRGFSSTGIQAFQKDSPTELKSYFIDTTTQAVVYYKDSSNSYTIPKGDIRYIEKITQRSQSFSNFYFVDDPEQQYYVNKSYISTEDQAVDRIVLWSGATYDATNDKLTLPNRYFAVSTSGKLYSAGAEINGRITADSGTIGGWKISKSGFSNGDTIYLKSDGSMKVGTNFVVTSTGKLSASDANIGGKITADEGRIGGWTIDGDTLTGGGVTLDANNGSITGAAISGGTLSISGGTSDSVTIDSNGVDITGKIHAEGGGIGGWTINENNLESNNHKVKLNANGVITVTTTDTDIDLISLTRTNHCVGYLGLMQGSSGDITNAALRSTTGVIVEAENGGAKLMSNNGVYLDVGTYEKEGNNVNYYLINRLAVQAAGLFLTQNGDSCLYGNSLPSGALGQLYFKIP